MYKHWKVIAAILTVLAVVGVCLAPSASAGGTETCVTGGCQFFPATFVPGENYVEVTKGHGKERTVISTSKIKVKMHKYEKAKHVHFNVYEKEEGSPSTRCVDPTKVKAWNFHVGDGFLNHGEEGLFPDTWEEGWEVCNWHIVKKGGREWVVGEKRNCGNTPIWIPIHSKIRKPKVKTIEVKSYAAFYAKYISPHKTTIKSESNFAVERTVASSGHYVCPADSELVGGNTCKCCVTSCTPREEHPCGCTPPPPPLVCPSGSVPNEKGTECVKNGYETPPPPVEAPGKNPPPSGGEGDPGSNMCYDEETGQPVPPREGLCPPGSYGSY